MLRLALREHGPLFDVALHFSGRSLVIEAEPVSADTIDAATLVGTMVERIDQIEDLCDFMREGARQICAMTGFDRVMVYRFDAVGSGEVVAESFKTGVDSFLGLKLPRVRHTGAGARAVSAHCVPHHRRCARRRGADPAGACPERRAA